MVQVSPCFEAWCPKINELSPGSSFVFNVQTWEVLIFSSSSNVTLLHQSWSFSYQGTVSVVLKSLLSPCRCCHQLAAVFWRCLLLFFFFLFFLFLSSVNSSTLPLALDRPSCWKPCYWTLEMTPSCHDWRYVSPTTFTTLKCCRMWVYIINSRKNGFWFHWNLMN